MVTLNNIEVRPTGICERDGKQLLAFVPREGITQLEIAHGFVSERPLLQAGFGGLLSFIGGLWSFHFLVGLMTDRPTGGRAGMAAIFLFSVGMLVLLSLLRRGPHLVVTTSKGTRKLHLRGWFDVSERDRFLSDARRLLDLF
jgi:hypothetical protein